MWRVQAHSLAPTYLPQARSLSNEANTDNEVAYRGASVWLLLRTLCHHPVGWRMGVDVSLCIASKAIH